MVLPAQRLKGSHFPRNVVRRRTEMAGCRSSNRLVGGSATGWATSPSPGSAPGTPLRSQDGPADRASGGLLTVPMWWEQLSRMVVVAATP